MERALAPNDFGTLRVNLPFDHTIVGYMIRANHQYVAWTRHHPMHPFGTHKLSPNGGCENGHYFETLSEALADLAERAGVNIKHED